MSSPTDRSKLQVRMFPLGHEPAEDLTASTTAAERLAMMWPLSVEAWALAGLALPAYARHETPITIVPLATSER